MKKAVLLLQNGEFFEGYSFGYEGETSGEVVFNTSMTGYQEVLTDPSYNGQIVTMTNPLIGNYGVNSEDVESEKIQVAGFVVRENSQIASNFRSEETLDQYLKRNRIVGIEGIDTRRLTRIIRIKGAMNGIISAVDFDKKSLADKLSKVPSIVGADLVKNVTIDKPQKWGEFKDGNLNIIAIHTGIKWNILRELAKRGANITLVPAKMSAKEILAMKPDGVFLANGPGDPEAVSYTADTIEELLGKVPLFGICLGHQLLSIALGAKTYKQRFGHRGGNQPVMNLKNGKVEITSQNHGFALKDGAFGDDVEVTHINLNDRTIEGIRHKKYPAFSVQYHPEAAPGPHDSLYIFDDFINMVKEWKTQ
jgi:carbamoyl-phosphate synthase small subunit